MTNASEVIYLLLVSVKHREGIQIHHRLFVFNRHDHCSWQSSSLVLFRLLIIRMLGCIVPFPCLFKIKIPMFGWKDYWINVFDYLK